MKSISAKRWLSLLLPLLVTGFLLSSCIEIKQMIHLNSDGSGGVRLELAIQSQWVQQLAPKVKSDIPSGWNILEENDRDGKHIMVFGRPFRNITELNDKNMEYVFVTDKKTSFTGSYNLDIRQIDNSQMPFPYEINVRMPGTITSTNGTKISSSEVRWNLQGFSQGTILSVRSSESMLSSPIVRIAGLVAGCFILLFIIAFVVRRKKKGKRNGSPYIPSSPAPGKDGPFCTQCGTRNRPEALFCISCGTRLEG